MTKHNDDYLRLSGAQRRAMLEQALLIFGNRCHICGLKIDRGEESLDHIKARSKGGNSSLANVRPAHKRCNSSKGDRDMIVPIHDGIAFFWPR